VLSETWALPATTESTARARFYAARCVQQWGVVADGLASVLTELVANAIRHTGDGCTVSVCLEGPSLLVEVADHSSDFPVLGSLSNLGDHGRGLHIVEAFSQRWGARAVPGGKIVWATLSATLVPNPLAPIRKPV
jgi:anti-sigma regulatory factor (Ser/Thr protein kinase)